MPKIKTYEFIDTETGDKFSGTKKELANHIGTARQTVDVRIRAGRIIAKETGKIDNSLKLTFTRIVNGKPDVFVGTKVAAAKHYDITDYALRRDIAKGEISVDDSAIKADLERKKKSTPLHFITDQKSDPETKRKLTKCMYDIVYAMGI
jgi:DNA-binding XRE family transcriptional regulator